MTLERSGLPDQALTRAFAVLGKRWSGLIVAALLESSARYSEIAQRIPGLNSRILSERLAELTAAGLVVRSTALNESPGAHYELTPRGEALRPAMVALQIWANEHLLESPVAGGTDAAG